MNQPSRTPRQRAFESCVMQASARRLTDLWRDRASAIRPHRGDLADLWIQASRELEEELSVAPRAETLERIVRGLASEIVQELGSLGQIARRADDHSLVGS